MGKENAQIWTPTQFSQALLSSGLSTNALRTNALLRKEEWVEFDTVVVDIARQRLTAAADLQSRGLVHPLGGLGTLVSQYEAQSDMTPANIDMAGVTPGEEDDVEFDLRSVPIPIIHKDFRINIRRLLASRKLGDSVDTTQAAVSSRRVADGIENMIFYGAGITVDGNAIFGYTNHPNTNLGAAVNAPAAFVAIANIYPTILNMIADAQADNYYGPYVLYVAADAYMNMLQVYNDGSGQTALERALKIPNLQDIKPADELANGELVLVTMVRDVVDLAVAQDVTTVQWDSLGGMMVHFKVLSALAPRVKSDHSGRSGIVYYTGA